MINHYRGCGLCWLCRMGYTQMCKQVEVMDTEIDGGNPPHRWHRPASWWSHRT
jgi:hypothetical protein